MEVASWLKIRWHHRKNKECIWVSSEVAPGPEWRRDYGMKGFDIIAQIYMTQMQKELGLKMEVAS